MPNAEKYELKKILAENGHCKYDDWFSTLSQYEQHLVECRLLRVRLGHFGDVKHLSGHISELRFRNGIRIYFLLNKNTVVLIYGGNKKTQTKDIKIAYKLSKNIQV